LAGIGLAGTSLFEACATNSKQQNNPVTVEYASATLEDGRTILTPFWRVDSGKNGPSLALIAAQHGNEVQGAEVARRFKDICSSQLVSGSVWLVPMANILAVRSRRHSFDLEPEQNNRNNPNKFHNMQRHWPGDPGGNDTARLAYAIDQKVLCHCTHAVDIHCFEHIKAALALSEEVHEPSRSMGDVTTTRFISYRNTVIPENPPMNVSQMMLKRGAGVHVMELSGQFQVRESQVITGLTSMMNIAKLLGMLEGDPEPVSGNRIVRSPEVSHDVGSPCAGIFMPLTLDDGKTVLGPEDYVEEGQNIGHVIREQDLETVPVTAPVSGYLFQYGLCHWGLCDASLPAQHPYTEERETLAVIVTV